MTESVAQVDWKESGKAFPPFVTLIATGLSLGLISHTVAKIAAGKHREISVPLWLLTILFVIRYVYLAAE